MRQANVYLTPEQEQQLRELLDVYTRETGLRISKSAIIARSISELHKQKCVPPSLPEASAELVGVLSI